MSATDPTRRANLAGFAVVPAIIGPIAATSAMTAVDTRRWDAIIGRWNAIVAQVDALDLADISYERGSAMERRIDRLSDEMNDAGRALRDASPPTFEALADKIDAIRRDAAGAYIEDETLGLIALDLKRLIEAQS